MNCKFVLPDPEPHAIQRLPGWSGFYNKHELRSWIFSPVTSSKLILIFLHTENILRCTHKHRDLFFPHRMFVFSYHHWHSKQFGWLSRWIRCFSWIYALFSRLFYYFLNMICSRLIKLLVLLDTSLCLLPSC